MKYNMLGNTGLFVSELCLGTMTFGGGGMWENVGSLGQPEVDKIMARSFEAGINFIDTANVYSDGMSEILTGQSLKNLKIPREDFVIATKVHGEMGKGVNSKGASRFHIMEAVKQSLKRLQVDHIDLYQLHGFDVATPIEETMEALDTLVRHGHVRYIGLSNWAAWRIAKAQGIAERLHLAKFNSLQAYYSLASRDLEREIIPMLDEENIGLMVWSPLAGGLLSGKFDLDGKTKGEGRRANFDFPPVPLEHAARCIEAMKGIALEKKVSVAQIALAWLLHQPRVTTVILGAKNTDQLNDNLKSVDVKLTDKELAVLDDVSKLTEEYPGWMLSMWGGARREQLAQSK